MIRQDVDRGRGGGESRDHSTLDSQEIATRSVAIHCRITFIPDYWFNSLAAAAAVVLVARQRAHVSGIILYIREHTHMHL